MGRSSTGHRGPGAASNDEHLAKFIPESLELRDELVERGRAALDQPCDDFARCLILVAERDERSDFSQSEPDRLRRPYEAVAIQCILAL